MAPRAHEAIAQAGACVASSRQRCLSRSGAPNRRLYSRLNCDELS